jgi:hypothetical protein
MKNNKTSKDTKIGKQAFPFYPLLFGLYPILALTAFNITQIDLSLTFRAFLGSLLLAAVLFAALHLVMRNWPRAAFLSLLLLILFYSYGHVYVLLKSVSLLGIAVGRHRLLLPIWVLLAGLAVWAAIRKSIHPGAVTSWLNILSALMLFYPVYQIAHYEAGVHAGKTAAAEVAATGAAPHSQQAYPDIYYIILDAYGRTDDLKEVYNYDNSAFTDALTQRGFYVAGCSQSNYAYTIISLASSLNMDYLEQYHLTADDQTSKLILTDAVRQFLRARGYTIVAFETGYRFTQLEDANVYYTYQPGNNLVNNFELLFLQTTLLRAPLDNLKLSEISNTYETKHNLVIHNLETLKKVPVSVKGPKFVFAHFVVPHGPYVFGPNWEALTPSQLDDRANLSGFRDSLTFINNAILPVVDQILATSKTPPIIVIQGDHGGTYWKRPDQRMKILNAYYLPGAGNVLYPSISPVNTFRIIFNTYFGQEFPLLPDVSRYSPPSPPSQQYNFNLVPNTCTN